MFGGIFYDFLEGPWENVRGYLREHLEQLQVTLSANWAKAFDTNGNLNSEVIDGNSTTAGVVYISNEGPGGKPKWAKVNLSTGVKNRLKFINLIAATSGNVVVGRDSGGGDFQQIDMGDALDISGAAMNVLVDGTTITVNGSNRLQVLAAPLAGNWVPLSLGTEPLQFVSDGSGNPIFTWYEP